jgi:putative AlgH/UPF0301 family transcriptional regulator
MDGPIISNNNNNNSNNIMENYNNTTNHNNINIREGTLLIASNDLPPTSSFYHSIILIIQESRNNNDDIMGIVINSSSTNPLLCLNLNCNESIDNNSNFKEKTDNNKMYTNDLLSRKLTTTITCNKKIGIEEKRILVKFNDNDHHHDHIHNNDLFNEKALNNISALKIGGPDNEDVLTMIHNYGLCSEYSESITVHHYKNHHHHRHQDYHHHHNNIIMNSSTNNRDSSSSSSCSIDLYVVNNDQYIHDTLASIHTYQNNKTSNGHFYHDPAHKSININQQHNHHNDHHHHPQHNQESFQIFQGNCIWQRTKLLDEINSGVWHVLSSDIIINQVDKECLHLSDIYNTIFMNSKWNHNKVDVWQKYYDSIEKIG